MTRPELMSRMLHIIDEINFRMLIVHKVFYASRITPRQLDDDELQMSTYHSKTALFGNACLGRFATFDFSRPFLCCANVFRLSFSFTLFQKHRFSGLCNCIFKNEKMKPKLLYDRRSLLYSKGGDTTASPLGGI